MAKQFYKEFSRMLDGFIPVLQIETFNESKQGTGVFGWENPRYIVDK